MGVRWAGYGSYLFAQNGAVLTPFRANGAHPSYMTQIWWASIEEKEKERTKRKTEPLERLKPELYR